MPAVPGVEDFRSAAVAYWRAIDLADADAASASTADVDHIAKCWQESGVSNERLTALLLDPSSEVRYAAAASLGPQSPLAVRTMRELSNDETALVAPTARLLLQTEWREVP